MKNYKSIVRGKLHLPTYIKKIIIIGLSGSGKTTVFTGLSKLNDYIFPVQRWISRPKRDNDSMSENLHVTKDEILSNLDKLNLHWSRNMGNNRFEFYAFPHIQSEKILLLPGNNALLDIGMDHFLFEDSIIISISVDDQIRESRFRSRSPDIVRSSPVEFFTRMTAIDVSDEFYHYRIINSIQHEGIIIQEISNLILRLIGQKT